MPRTHEMANSFATQLQPHSMIRLGAENIGVWIVHRQNVTEEQLGVYSRWLTSEERERQAGYLLEEDRTHLLIGRGLARELLAHFTRRHPSEIVFQIDPNGKPFASGTELCLNISHSAGYVAVALALSRPIGIDIQCSTCGPGRDTLLSISELFFSPVEHDQLSSLTGSRQRHRFFILWTLKEAYLKALGSGLGTPLNRPVFRFSDASRFSFHDAGQGELWSFSGFHLGTAAVGVASAGMPLEVSVIVDNGQPVHLRVGAGGNTFSITHLGDGTTSVTPNELALEALDRV